MTRKTKNDKKGTTCEHCGKKCSMPQKLHEHLNRKFPCKPQETIQTTSVIFLKSGSTRIP